ncbi:MAG: type II toxin-antitoxin system Phd/YefM family antitoxin [Nitriliruptoraceae bacterium]
MRQVNVHEAKTHLSRLLADVEAGEEIVIARGGRPVARLVKAEVPERRLGLLAGRLEVADDFDAPLPDDIAAAFEGRA